MEHWRQGVESRSSHTYQRHELYVDFPLFLKHIAQQALPYYGQQVVWVVHARLTFLLFFSVLQ